MLKNCLLLATLVFVAIDSSKGDSFQIECKDFQCLFILQVYHFSLWHFVSSVSCVPFFRISSDSLYGMCRLSSSDLSAETMSPSRVFLLLYNCFAHCFNICVLLRVHVDARVPGPFSWWNWIMWHRGLKRDFAESVSMVPNNSSSCWMANTHVFLFFGFMSLWGLVLVSLLPSGVIKCSLLINQSNFNLNMIEYLIAYHWD